VWKDANQNGEAESWELTDLAANGIASISTAYTESATVDAHGNEHRQVGTYGLAGGGTRAAVDVWFDTNRAHTRDASPASLSEDVQALPDAKGFGEVHSLRVAMADNATLKALVQQYVVATDPIDRDNLLDPILFEWTGTTGVDPSSRGPNIDARLLEAMEKFVGEIFGRDGAEPDPWATSARIIEAQFDDVRQFLRAQLVAQTHDKAAFDLIRIEFDENSGRFGVTLDAFTSYLNSLAAAGNSAKVW
jgi:hypothetical protein